jgi:predicted dehydrogenase
MPPDTKAPITRRNVLPGVAAGTAAMIVPRHVLGGPGYQPPSDTLAIAGVGVGGMGRRYLDGCAGERIVALCDVDHELSAKVFRKHSSARVYKDWRVLFEKEKNFDALIVGTPDHWHAIITLAALRAGKHVYCAKPLTHTIVEARKVAEAATQAKVATQTSVQSSASEEACSTAEVLLSGIIGPVHEVHVWCDHPIYPAGQVRPKETPAVPAGLDWEMWIGPAPYRPYSPAYHPWIWRSWWDFGTGTVGDMASHAFHVFFRALELGTPEAVHGSRTKMHGGLFRPVPGDYEKEYLPPLIETPESESYSCMVVWDFPARGSHPPLRLHWYDGGLKPPRPREFNRKQQMPASGVLYFGSKGKLLTAYSGGRNRLLPEDKYRNWTPPEKTLPRTIGHYREWIAAAKTGKPTTCDFTFGARLAETALLGTLAARVARYLEFDPATAAITNDTAANALVHPPYRQGWHL